MNTVFEKLGAWLALHGKRMLALWLVILLAGGWGARQLPSVVVGGSGALAGSPSQQVDEVLHSQFANPFIQPLLLTISSERYRVDDPTYRRWIEQAGTRLEQLLVVRRVTSYLDTPSPQLRSADGHQTVLLVGLSASNVEQQEHAVPLVRAALADLAAQVRRDDPAAQLAVAGHAAVTYDVNDANKHGGDRAETRALPLTLAILVLSFGALVAAGIPLLMGLASTTVALGLAYGLAAVMPVSNLLQNVITMIGLALGIDYSLLMVSRFRELLPGRSTQAAVALMLGETGPTITCSGLTVMIGLLGLLFSPLMETRSIGIGGTLVVLVSMLAALTLVPALLALLGPRIDMPRPLARRLDHARAEAFWGWLAAGVVRRPWRTLALAAGLVGLLVYPGTQARSGFNNDPWFFPAGMESRVGSETLARMGNRNAGLPIYLVVHTADGRPVLDPGHLPALVAFGERLAHDPRIGAVVSPVNLDPAFGEIEYSLLYHDPAATLRRYPQISELGLSRDRQAALFQVTADGRLGLLAIQALAKDLANSDPGPSFRLQVGGPPVYYNDFADFMWASFPAVAGFVIGATLLLLFLVFRSWLLPLKAVAMNLLAVAAGFGVVVAVFQFGWLADWVGLERPFTTIPLTVPLMVFCLSFGLSMDYEVFLLSRIKRRFDETGDNDTATRYGLAHTGPVITGAALIMAVVFGAFIGAGIALLKMIGLGLTVAVLVDATLIRCLMVPALMTLAGRWNWYPGSAVRPTLGTLGESHEYRSSD